MSAQVLSDIPKVIVLDLNDTIVDTRRAFSEARIRLLRNWGALGETSYVECDQAWRDAESQALDRVYGSSFEHYLISEVRGTPWHQLAQEFFQERMVGFAAEYGIALTAERAQDSDNLLEKFASEYALVFEDAILLATLLKSIGVKLAIVTDNLVGSAGSLVEKARRALNPDSVLISQASHFSKLNPAFPLVALTSLAVTPEDAWYVGDRLVEDGIWPSVYGVRTFVLCRNCQHIDPESNHLTSLTALPLPISVDRRR